MPNSRSGRWPNTTWPIVSCWWQTEPKRSIIFTGGDASRAASGLNPILLLLDLKMPKVNGLEVLRQMKKSPELVDIPVVMLSSSCEELDLIEAQELGASAFVVKPVRFQDFVDAVKTIGRFWGVLNILRPGGIEAARTLVQPDAS